MSRQLKVIFVPLEKVAAVLLGHCKVRNVPGDAQVIGFHPVNNSCYGKGLGLLLTSQRFQFIPHGEPLPVCVASFSGEAAA